MRRRITPIQLKVLLHYYSEAEDLRPLAPKIQEALDWWIDLSMLKHRAGRDMPTEYSLTHKGRWYIDELLLTPLPIATFFTPDREQD